MAIRAPLPANPAHLATWIASDPILNALVILLTYDFHPIRADLTPMTYTQLRAATIHAFQTDSDPFPLQLSQTLTRVVFPRYQRANPHAALPWTLLDLWTFCDASLAPALDPADPRMLLHWWRLQQPQALDLERAHHDRSRLLNTDPWRTLPHGLWKAAWPIAWPWTASTLHIV